MDYIKSFTEEEFCTFILQTKESLYICLPLLHPKVIESIHEVYDNHRGGISINIGLDFSPETFRQGYGEIVSYEDSWMEKYNVQQMKDNRISFVIADSVGYFLFFESRYLLPADKVTLNAVLIDPISLIRLKQHFFKSFKRSELSDHIANAIIEESNQLKNIESEFLDSGIVISSVINQTIIDDVRESLKKNPPIKPDYKRIVEFYSNKFQYAKLVFKGSNIMYHKIDLPKDVLPIIDAELKEKLETRLNLFDKNDDEECFKPLNEFKVKIANLRETFFTKIKSREESLVSMQHKVEFVAKYELLKEELITVKADIISKLAKQIESTKTRLLEDLKDFFLVNPQALFPNDPYLWQNKAYIETEAKSVAQDLICNPKKIKWPKSHILLDEFKLSVQFSDITIEDLRNKEFIKELKEARLIGQADINFLAEFGIAIGVIG
ncbi:MAG: hypothetical protein K0M50_09940 [Prolixibacteraceae bacterium]|nr:hypothetical protein [Prolixibacteraceae bacterium]